MGTIPGLYATLLNLVLHCFVIIIIVYIKVIQVSYLIIKFFICPFILVSPLIAFYFVSYDHSPPVCTCISTVVIYTNETIVQVVEVSNDHCGLALTTKLNMSLPSY